MALDPVLREKLRAHKKAKRGRLLKDLDATDLLVACDAVEEKDVDSDLGHGIRRAYVKRLPYRCEQALAGRISTARVSRYMRRRPFVKTISCWNQDFLVEVLSFLGVKDPQRYLVSC